MATQSSERIDETATRQNMLDRIALALRQSSVDFGAAMKTAMKRDEELKRHFH